MSLPFSTLKVAALIAFSSLLFSSLLYADDIQTHVTFVCNGEHLFVESSNIRDLSDNSTCMVAHPDKMRPNGFPTYTDETRGALKKLLPTCQQPSAQLLAGVQAAQKKANAAYNAAVNPPQATRATGEFRAKCAAGLARKLQSEWSVRPKSHRGRLRRFRARREPMRRK